MMKVLRAFLQFMSLVLRDVGTAVAFARLVLVEVFWISALPLAFLIALYPGELVERIGVAIIVSLAIFLLSSMYYLFKGGILLLRQPDLAMILSDASRADATQILQQELF